MKTSELIEELKWVMDTEGKPYQEIVEKLRQLEDIRRIMSELLNASITIDKLCCDLLEITNLQEDDINYGEEKR